MMDRISGAVMSLAVAVFGMVSPLSAQAENLARYSLDGGVTWTEAATMDDALLVVNAQDNDAIVEAMADQNFFVYPSDLFWHGMTLNCNLTLRSSPNSAAACKITRGTTDGNNTWKISGGKTMTVANIVVDAGSGLANGLFSIASDGALNLEEGALITTSAESNPGNAVKVSGTLRFNGGVVRGWAVSGAPVVYGASTGRIYLSAGGVENCSTTGSGVMVASAIGSGSYGFSGITDPVFVMTGGFIRNNVCADTGSGYKAALAFRENVVIEITGGEITGNTGASETAFGVILGQNSKLNIGGSAVISGNTVVSGSAANVGCVQISGNIFEVIQVSNLTSDADIGVWSNNFTENSVFGKLATAGFTGAEYIHNDRDAALVGSADDTNLKWTSGGEPPVDPEEPLPVYTLTIPAQTGLELGADAVTTNDVPVAGVAGVYSIVSNTEVTINFKAASGYQIVSGNPVVVTVEADMALDQFPTVKKQGGDDPVADGWTAEPMDSEGAKFSTQGNLKYAYAANGGTVNSVAFTRATSLRESDSIAFFPADCQFGTVFMNEGVFGDFGTVLNHGWFWKEDGVTSRTVTLTLKNLTSGKKYLVQVLSHTMWNNNLVVSAGGCTPQHVHGSDEASGKYGALLTGVFTASATAQVVSISFANGDGEHPINAIQVRELPVKKGPTIIYW